MSPGVPKLGKTMQEQRQRTVTRRHAVEANAIGLDELVIHRSSIREPSLTRGARETVFAT